jgi:hypothetical protein
MEFNINNLIKELLSDLSDRQIEVITKRYGLMEPEILTLEELGKKYSVTRERIRQIESFSLNRIKKAGENNKAFNKIIETATNHLKNFGGLRREDLFATDLKYLAKNNEAVNLLINRLKLLFEVSGKINYSVLDDNFYAFWYLTEENRDHAFKFVKNLKTALKNKKEEILSHKKFDELFNQVIKPHRLQDSIAMNYASISKDFAVNYYGDFGLSVWPEIVPKTARDWAYLVLKRENKPLHFTDLAEYITRIRKDKKTNTATVHNELIKDERFVLVGRGTYGLREFGIIIGTAKEVLHHFLKKHGPLKSNELVKLVLTERAFKPNTLLINLQNKNNFKRLSDGRYTIREA